MFKNTASQKLTVLAFADAGHASLDAGEPVTGDAANITCKAERDDDGTQSATDDVNPTEVEDGQYRFDLTQAETNGDKLTFYPESSTAGVQVVALPSMVIYTRPPNFSALGIESDGDLTKVNTLNNHTPQTANHTTNIAAIKAKTDLLTTGTSVTLLNPVGEDGSVTIVSGDGYYNADSRALEFSYSGFPSFTGGSCKLILVSGGTTLEKSGTVVSATDIRFDLTEAETAAFSPATNASFRTEVTLSGDGHVVSPEIGKLVIKKLEAAA